jgi:predicted RNA-binding Zn ribbon-like protein
VPPAAELLREFVNTRDVEDGTDRLGSAASLGDWFVAHGLLASPAPVSDGDLRLALELREALRGALLAHHDGADFARANPALERVVAELPLRLTFPAGEPRVAPATGGARGALAGLVAAVDHAVAEGAWSRLKACPADTCQWAFYDTSKNRSRTWCAMAVCGNRAKTRSYRSRHGSG